MRVVMKDSSPASSGCTTYNYGETEDYCVTLTDGTSGISEPLTQVAVQLYPQPADQTLNITTAHTGALAMQVTDMTGRSILEHRFTGGNTIVSTEQLVTGMYLYRIMDQGAVIARGSFMVAR